MIFIKSWTQYWQYFLFFIEYMQWKYIFWNNTTVCVPYVKPVFLCRLFCFWTKKPVLIEKTRFLSTVFLGGKFSKFPWGKMFAVSFVCGNYICRSLEKSQKLEPAKHFMPHGRFQNMITAEATNTSFDRVLSFNEGKKYFSKILTKNMHIYSRNNHIKLPRKY